MVNLLVTVVLGMLISGATTNENNGCEKMQESSTSFCSENASSKKTYPFNTQFAVNKLADTKYELMVVMDLEEGSYYGSPYSNNSFRGLFNIEVKKNKYFVLGDSLHENPRSKPEYDVLSRENVNWVRESTTYTQTLELKKTTDFRVSGVVSFVIEPMCNRFEVGFEIRNQSNRLTVLKKDTKIANF